MKNWKRTMMSSKKNWRAEPDHYYYYLDELMNVRFDIDERDEKSNKRYKVHNYFYNMKGAEAVRAFMMGILEAGQDAALTKLSANR